MSKLSESQLKILLHESQALATDRLRTIETLTTELRTVRTNLDEERAASGRKSIEYLVALEKNVNLTAERDALMLALVAAYRTRKP
jgi:hypothetical protein